MLPASSPCRRGRPCTGSRTDPRAAVAARGHAPLSLPAMWPGQQQPPGGEQNPQQPNPYQQQGSHGSRTRTSSRGTSNRTRTSSRGTSNSRGIRAAAASSGARPRRRGSPSRRGRRRREPDEARRHRRGHRGRRGGRRDRFPGPGRRRRQDSGGRQTRQKSAAPAPSPGRATARTTTRAASGAEDAAEPVVPGWKVVVNPKCGIAFDVPADWDVKSPGTWPSASTDEKDGRKPLIAHVGARRSSRRSGARPTTTRTAARTTPRWPAAGTKGRAGRQGHRRGRPETPVPGGSSAATPQKDQGEA